MFRPTKKKKNVASIKRKLTTTSKDGESNSDDNNNNTNNGGDENNNSDEETHQSSSSVLLQKKLKEVKKKKRNSKKQQKMKVPLQMTLGEEEEDDDDVMVKSSKKKQKKKMKTKLKMMSSSLLNYDDDEDESPFTISSSNKKNKKKRKNSSGSGGGGGGMGYGGSSIMMTMEEEDDDNNDDEKNDTGRQEKKKADKGSGGYGKEELERLKSQQQKYIPKEEEKEVDNYTPPTSEKPPPPPPPPPPPLSSPHHNDGATATIIDDDEDVDGNGTKGTTKKRANSSLPSFIPLDGGDDGSNHHRRDLYTIEGYDNEIGDYEEEQLRNNEEVIDVESNEQQHRYHIRDMTKMKTTQPSINKKPIIEMNQLHLQMTKTIKQIETKQDDINKTINKKTNIDLQSIQDKLNKHNDDLHNIGKCMEYYQELRLRIIKYVSLLRPIHNKIRPLFTTIQQLEHDKYIKLNKDYWINYENDMIDILHENNMLQQVLGNRQHSLIDNVCATTTTTTVIVDEFGRDIKSQRTLQREKRSKERTFIKEKKQKQKQQQQKGKNNDEGNFTYFDDISNYVYDGDDSNIYNSRLLALREAFNLCVNDLLNISKNTRNTDDDDDDNDDDEFSSTDFDIMKNKTGIISNNNNSNNNDDVDVLSVTTKVVIQKLIQLFVNWSLLYEDEYNQCYANLSLIEFVNILIQVQLCYGLINNKKKQFHPLYYNYCCQGDVNNNRQISSPSFPFLSLYLGGTDKASDSNNHDNNNNNNDNDHEKKKKKKVQEINMYVQGGVLNKLLLPTILNLLKQPTTCSDGGDNDNDQKPSSSCCYDILSTNQTKSISSFCIQLFNSYHTATTNDINDNNISDCQRQQWDETNVLFKKFRQQLVQYVNDYLNDISIPIIIIPQQEDQKRESKNNKNNNSNNNNNNEIADAIEYTTKTQVWRITQILINIIQYWVPTIKSIEEERTTTTRKAISTNTTNLDDIVLDFISTKFLLLLSSIQQYATNTSSSIGSNISSDCSNNNTNIGRECFEKVWVKINEHTKWLQTTDQSVMLQAAGVRAAAFAYGITAAIK